MGRWIDGLVLIVVGGLLVLVPALPSVNVDGWAEPMRLGGIGAVLAGLIVLVFAAGK